MEPHEKFTFFEKYYWRRWHMLRSAHLNPNDGTSSFIEKARVTSCELPKLPLTRSPSFTGREGSRLDRFTDVYLWYATLYCRFGVLLQSDTTLLLQRETLTFLVTWNFKLAQPLSGSATLSLRDLQKASQSNLVFEGSVPESSGGWLPVPLLPPMTTWSCMSIRE